MATSPKGTPIAPDVSVVLYPSSSYSQRADEPIVPLTWAIQFLGILKAAIDPRFQETARIAWAGPEVTYIRPKTPLELDTEKKADLAAIAATLQPGDRVTPELIAAIEQALNGG